MKDSKTSLRRSLPELTQSEPLQQTLHLRSLIEWWQLAQHPDFTLDIQEWEHALRESLTWLPAPAYYSQSIGGVVIGNFHYASGLWDGGCPWQRLARADTG
jgi:hypothetical protein